MVFSCSEQEARQKIESIEHFSIVKVFRDSEGHISSCVLHDEMRDLLLEYYWRKEDRSGALRASYTTRALAYYDGYIDKETKGILRDNLRRERLYYLLKSSPDQGWEAWRSLKDDVSHESREALNEEIRVVADILIDNPAPEKRPEWLTPERLLELRYSDAEIAFANTRYEDAARLAEEILATPGLDNKTAAQARNLRLKTYPLRGLIPQALELGEKDMQWYAGLKASNYVEYFSRMFDYGVLHMIIGWAHRLDHKAYDAARYYEDALKWFEEAPGIEESKRVDMIATTRTNLAFVYDLIGRDVAAMAQCLHAEHLRHKTKHNAGLGLTYNVRGMMEMNAQRYEHALKYFALAESAFTRAGDDRGKALVGVARGRLLRQRGWFKVRPKRGNLDNIADVRDKTPLDKNY